MTLQGFLAFLKHRWMPMVFFAFVFSMIFTGISHFIGEAAADRRSDAEIKAIRQGVEQIIEQNNGQTKYLEALINQNRDMVQALGCLLVVHDAPNSLTPEARQDCRNRAALLLNSGGVQGVQDMILAPTPTPAGSQPGNNDDPPGLLNALGRTVDRAGNVIQGVLNR